MRQEQIERLERAEREKIFLLQKNIEDHRCIFNICGSTKNVYNISFYYGSGKIFCNCPDGRGQCKNIGVFCKHICFIITKVFSKIFNINDSNIFNILIFNQEEIAKIKDFIYKELQFDSTFMDQSIIDKFNNIRTALESKDKTITIEMINDMECPICYDEFENVDVQSCGVCCQIFHNNCINIWLSNSPNKSCPYCRSPMKSIGSYVNLE